jgi:hypothetical protein
MATPGRNLATVCGGGLGGSFCLGDLPGAGQDGGVNVENSRRIRVAIFGPRQRGGCGGGIADAGLVEH